MGPNRLGVETWLNLHIKISTKAKRMNYPPSKATTPYLIRNLTQWSQMINPKFFAAYAEQAEEETLSFTLEEMISEFNLSYRPSKWSRAVIPTLAGEPTSKKTDTPPDTSVNRGRCAACGGCHNVKKCRNLFEELRPDGWVVNKPQERRCQEYLKTSDGKKVYQEQKKHFAAHPPRKPTLQPSSKTRKASEDP
jgi:hypothetical protein